MRIDLQYTDIFLRLKILRAVLAIAGELTEPALVNRMNLLPYRASSELGQRCASFMPVATTHVDEL